MPRRVRNKADKQARIAAAARELFEERGFDATTIRAIAVRAEVATGTVLLYGESKTELLFALFVDELEESIDAQEATLDPSAPLADQLTHLFFGPLDRYAAHPALSRVYIKETLFQAPSPQAERYDALTLRFLARLAALIAARGDLRPEVDPPTTALSAFALYLVQVIEMLRQHGAASDVAVHREALHGSITRMLRPLEAR